MTVTPTFARTMRRFLMTMIQRSLFAACTACLFSAGVTLGQTEQSFDDLFSDLDSLLPQDAPATVTASEAPAEEVWSDLDTIANSEATAADANAESASEPEVASEPQMTDAAEVEEP
ncbi:MAG: hypothetical protein KDL10_11660, partial [Kiritimatiellae bacterium]|nr:hypothetical protein [Kiritimatiellia bacterium]